MDFEIVTLVEIDEVTETATIEGEKQGTVVVPLWEVVGFTRNSDQFHNWKYALTGE